MSAYSTYTDFYNAFGANTVRAWLSDGIAGAEFEDQTDDEGVVTPGVNTKVTWFLEKSAAKINSYLVTRYAMPISNPGDDIKECEIALAAYRMTNKPTAIQPTKVKDGYTDAIEWLKGVAAGTIDLGYTTVSSALKSTNEFTAETRQFTHTSMRGSGGL
jgi:phage gp36-like protein